MLHFDIMIFTRIERHEKGKGRSLSLNVFFSFLVNDYTYGGYMT